MAPLFLSSFLPLPHPLLIPSCPVDSASGEEWSSWSVCSATCGEGWQSRTRFCVSSSYSTQCSGPLREQRPCNNSAVCAGKPSPLHSPCPVPFQRRPAPLPDLASLTDNLPDSALQSDRDARDLLSVYSQYHNWQMDMQLRMSAE